MHVDVVLRRILQQIVQRVERSLISWHRVRLFGYQVDARLCWGCAPSSQVCRDGDRPVCAGGALMDMEPGQPRGSAREDADNEIHRAGNNLAAGIASDVSDAGRSAATRKIGRRNFVCR